ncbi:hypothetical protein ABPG77_004606 [Micractinium sp. CCAP 211/92]
MHRKHFLAAQAWYAISQGAPAFLNPFLNLFFTKLGITPAQIGLLSALRPWISAPCGSLIAGLADRWGAHRFLLLACYLAVTWIQGLMALPAFASFSAMLALTAASSCVYTPSQILADAAVMAASDHPGDYGRLRTMASVSWTAFAPLAGWVNSTFGIRVGIACYVAGSMLAVPAAWMLPVEALRRKVAPVIERMPSKEGEQAVSATAVEAGGLPELRQPLLAEEAPIPVTQRAGLARALAIVRYIEAITELGVAPPPGVGLYGFAALPLSYVSQHLAPAEGPEAADASPGYSPFAGAAEPGSVSPEVAALVRDVPAGAALQTPAALTPDGGSEEPAGSQPEQQRPEMPRGHTVHGSSDALQSIRRPTGGAERPLDTEPRPMAAQDPGAAASLAQGPPPPPVRTRPLAVPPTGRPQQQPAEGEESSSLEGFVVLPPHGTDWEGEWAGSEEGAEKGEENEPLFSEEDRQAGQHAAAARQQPRQLHNVASASALLRDVRAIRMLQLSGAGPQAAAALPARAAAEGVAGGRASDLAAEPGGHAGLFGLTGATYGSSSALPAERELMREALDLELREARQDADATGSMVVGMLSKKLERMAREARRQQRLQRRAARQRAKAAAAAAAAAPSAAPLSARREPEEAALGVSEPRLSAMAEERPATAAAPPAEPEQLGFGAALKRLFTDAQVVTFFSLCTILGFGHGIIGGFLFMHLADLGGSELLMGAVLTANALPELPAFYYFGSILSAMGMYTLLFTATATLGLRIWAYSLLPRIGLKWIVPIEALHAVTYACGWSASAVNSSKIAPPGLEGTTQGLFQGLWTGVGCGLAGILGGVLYGSHGAEFLFRLSGLAILGCTAASAVPALLLRQQRKRHAREPLPSKESVDDLAALSQH